MKVISTKKAPTAIGPYSQAIQVGNLVYTSGKIPIDPALSSHYGRNRFYHAHPKVFVSYRGGRHEHFSHR